MAQEIIESDELRLKRYEELYALTKEGVATETERYRVLDEKAAKYFTALNLLLAVVAITGKEALSYLLPPSSWIDLLCLLLIAIAIALLLVALGFILRVISVRRAGTMSAPPVDKAVSDLFDSHDYTTAIYTMSQTNITVVSEDRKASEIKAGNLASGSNFILAAIIAFGLFIGAFSIRLSFNSSKVSDPMKETSSATQTSERPKNQVPLPDKTVTPPKPVPISEGSQPTKTLQPSPSGK